MPLNVPSARTRRAALARLAAMPAALAGCAGLPGGAPGASPPVRLPALSRTQAYRLVNRLSWGANDAEMARLDALGPAAWLQAQLQPAASDDALPAAVQAQITALRIHRQPLDTLVAEAEALRRRGEAATNPGANLDERASAQQAYQRHLTGLAREAAARHLLRALYSPQQLQQQMVWFWLNHFSVHQFKGGLRAMVGDYEERAIRPHALGRFRDLLGAVVHHPAMLVYLDNAQNGANRLNENLARELLELHTLGVDGGYSQADVQALARVLTGHGVQFGGEVPRLRPEWQAHWVQQQGYVFHPGRHDWSAKRVLGAEVPGRGAAELDQVLDALARHPATARHVSAKLAQFLLGDQHPAALVDRMAAAWLRHDGRIAEVLQVLATDPACVAEPAWEQTSPLKDPTHFVLSAVRAAWTDDTPVRNTLPLQTWLVRMGQGLYNRPTPDGYPMGAAHWTGSGQMATRFEIARTLGAGAPQLFRPEPLEPAAPPPMATAASGGGMAMSAGGMVAMAPTAAPAAPAPQASLPTAPRPMLARPLYHQLLQGLLRPPTRQVLAGATGPAQWNMLYLSSPEFMLR